VARHGTTLTDIMRSEDICMPLRYKTLYEIKIHNTWCKGHV